MNASGVPPVAVGCFEDVFVVNEPPIYHWSLFCTYPFTSAWPHKSSVPSFAKEAMFFGSFG